MEDLFLSEVSKLNENQQILLKDTILHGEWGDCDMEFLDENGDTETDSCYGFITNDAKEDGSGDVLFIRKSAYDVAWAWAEGKEI